MGAFTSWPIVVQLKDGVVPEVSRSPELKSRIFFTVAVPAICRLMALIVIPYFNINIEAEGLFLKDRKRRVFIFYIAATVLCVFLLAFDVLVALVPTLVVVGFMMVAVQSSPQSRTAFRRYLAGRPLSYWIMTWFLFELIVLTAVGTFFRGPGWSWVLPWRS